MSTSAQQIANTANAQKSTGPITPEGKMRSAMNSHRHGLCAKDIVVGPEESADYESMAVEHFIDLSPRGAVELTLFNEILAAAWQLGRVRRMETEACAGKMNYSEILDDEPLQKKLDRLARHHTRIERTFHRCLKTLKALQVERRKEKTITSDDVADRAQSKLRRADVTRQGGISERSQSAGPADRNDILTPEELAEIDRDFGRMEANIAEELRKRERKAA
jgi:hypothetical protein